MGVTPFNELFTTYENMQTLDEIKEELAELQDSLINVPDPIEEILNSVNANSSIKDYRMPLWQVRTVASHNYTKGYIDALKWVIREKERK